MTLQLTAKVTRFSIYSRNYRTEKQVFHVPSNIYTYDNAGALCNAYGAQLASYDQIEDAYNSGAEWCNYGWSKDQMAYYPTQKSTYEKLKSNAWS